MIRLNDKKIPDFVKVNEIKYSILAPIENHFLKVRGKKGQYHFGQDAGQRTIQAAITIVSEKVNGVMAKTRELAAWLHNPEPVKLVIEDEPDKYYIAVPDGDTNISEIVSIGQGEISFICIEPDAYGKARELTTKQEGTEPFYFEVDGTAETFPEIELTVKENLPSIGLISGDGAVLIGEPEGVEKEVIDTKPLVMNDHMLDLDEWANGNIIDGGTVTGDMENANGQGVSQKGKDYGTGTLWHGSAKVFALPKQVQDFELAAWVTHKATHINQVGRVEIYLLDANNAHLGKIALVDNHAIGEYPKFEARAGTWKDGYYFGNHFGSTQGKLKNFYGQLKISRKGNVWTASVNRQDANTFKYTKEVSVSWIDISKNISNKVASIQIHVGAYKTYAPTASLTIGRVDVSELVSTNTDTEASAMVNAGDVITIDCSKSLVYKNGEVFYEGINPSSDFFSLKPGLNGLQVTAPNTEVKINYTERWL